MRNIKNNTKNNITSDLTDEKKDLINKVYKIWLIYMVIDPEIRINADADARHTALAEAAKSYRLTTKRRDAIAHRLDDAGYDMIVGAIKNLAKSPWHRDGENDRGWKAGLETFLLRNYEKVEEWANKSNNREENY